MNIFLSRKTKGKMYCPSNVGADCISPPKCSPKKKKKKIIYIEGNIGAGKTSLLHCLDMNGYVTIKEPVKLFDQALTNFYVDPKKNAFNMQCTVVCCIQNSLVHTLRNFFDESVLIFERSLVSCRIFTDNSREKEYLTAADTEIVNHLISRMEQDTEKYQDEYEIVYIYLMCPVEICAQRITKRNRRAEVASDSFLNNDMQSYLHSLERLHQIHLHDGKRRVEVIDASKSLSTVLADVMQIINE